MHLEFSFFIKSVGQNTLSTGPCPWLHIYTTVFWITRYNNAYHDCLINDCLVSRESNCLGVYIPPPLKLVYAGDGDRPIVPTANPTNANVDSHWLSHFSLRIRSIVFAIIKNTLWKRWIISYYRYGLSWHCLHVHTTYKWCAYLKLTQFLFKVLLIVWR